MKNFKRFLSMALAVLMVAALAMTAFAADDSGTDTGTIKISNIPADETGVIYKAALLLGYENDNYVVPEKLVKIYKEVIPNCTDDNLVESVLDYLKNTSNQGLNEKIRANSPSVAEADNGVIANLNEGYYFVRKDITNSGTRNVSNVIYVKPGVTSTVNLAGTIPETGNIVIEPSLTIGSNGSVPLAGKTFTSYKILNMGKVGEAYLYSIPENLKPFYQNYFLTDKDETVPATDEALRDAVIDKLNALQNDSTELFAFAKAALAEAKKLNETTPGTVESYSGSLQGDGNYFIGNIPYGYYVIEDKGEATPISALLLDTVEKNVNINIKAEKPSVDKNIIETTEDGTTTESKTNEAAIGDTVKYQIKSKVPSMLGYTKYYFYMTDTLSKGLTYTEDKMEVKVDNKTLIRAYTDGNSYYSDKDCKNIIKPEDLAANYYYTLTVTPVTKNENSDDYGKNTLEIVFVDFLGKYNNATFNGKDIVVTYEATLNKDAVIDGTGNPNEVILNYSNNPNSGSENDEKHPDKPKDPVGKTPKSETFTYTTKVQITKKGNDDNTLKDAKFKIKGTAVKKLLVTGVEYVVNTDQDSTEMKYYKLADGSYTTMAPSTEEDADNSKYDQSSLNNVYKKVSYTRTETENKETEIEAFVGDDGKLIFEGLAEGVYTITELVAPESYNKLDKNIILTITFDEVNKTWTYDWKYDGATTSFSNQNAVEIINYKGNELPSTGGIGTTIFYIVGSVLLVGAGVLLVTKKRMSESK